MNVKIGIDPGNHTGVAVTQNGQLIWVVTLKLHRAMIFVRHVCETFADTERRIYIEDGRKRFGRPMTNVSLTSLKRDCKIWEEYLREFGLSHEFVKPSDGWPGLDAAVFNRLTHWDQRTSQHARDATMLIWGEHRFHLWQPDDCIRATGEAGRMHSLLL